MLSSYAIISLRFCNDKFHPRVGTCAQVRVPLLRTHYKSGALSFSADSGMGQIQYPHRVEMELCNQSVCMRLWLLAVGIYRGNLKLLAYIAVLIFFS